MNARNGMRPVHPGEVLREEIQTIEWMCSLITQEALSSPERTPVEGKEALLTKLSSGCHAFPSSPK